MTGTLLTTVEVAERLGLSSAAVAQAVRTGALQPTARTADDFLFSERAVATFAERRARAAASPLQPPVAGSRVEWTGDVDRLNSWLKDLTDAVPGRPPLEASTAVPAPSPAAAIQAPAPEPDFRPPPPPAPVAEIQLPPQPVPEPEPGPEIAPPSEPPAPPAPEPEPQPPQTEPEPEPVSPPEFEPEPETAPEPNPIVDTGPLEAVARPELGPVPQPAVAPEPSLAAPVLAAPVQPAPEAAPSPAPEQTPGLVLAAPVQPAPSSGLSRQAILVIEPIDRFRVLREVADRLAAVPGIADARLERLESGLATYRVSFAEPRPSGEAIAGALAPLGLQVMLVDSQ